MTGKKIDNRDCAIKNPDKWGAEKNENDNNRIERSVKDDDPAKAGFFCSQDSSGEHRQLDRSASPRSTSRCRRPLEQRTTLPGASGHRPCERQSCRRGDDGESARAASRAHFHLGNVQTDVAGLLMRVADQHPHLDSRATCTHNAPARLTFRARSLRRVVHLTQFSGSVQRRGGAMSSHLRAAAQRLVRIDHQQLVALLDHEVAVLPAADPAAARRISTTSEPEMSRAARPISDSAGSRS